MAPDTNRKLLLLSAILLSFVVYIPLILADADRLTVGRFIGFFGLQLIWWQVLLGNRQLMRFTTEDLIWVNRRHQLSGMYGFLIILLHPLFMVSTYGASLILQPSFASSFDIGVRLGTLAMAILTFIWISSALLRGKLQWRWWKRLHSMAYILFPILFAHMLITGSSIQQFSWLALWLYFLATMFCLVILLRVAGWAGITKHRYQLIEMSPAASHVTRFRMQPLGRSMTPRPGQFAYLQTSRFGEAHPFTLSHFDATSGEISFSIKAVGPYSRHLSDLRPGDTVFIDGPYGIFTHELGKSSRQTVVIAGGIGITPFIRHLENKKIQHLFWGCRTEADIAYRDVVESSGAKVHYVCSDEVAPKTRGTKGKIDASFVMNNLDLPLTEYDFYLCGPEPMMKSLRSQLLAQQVPSVQIHQEKFSL